MTVTDPSASSVESLAVATVSVTLPDIGTVTVREPGDTPKSPAAATATVTSNPADGVGTAVTVNVATPPSPMLLLSAETLTSGSGCGGSGSTADCAGMPSTVSVNDPVLCG